MSDFCMTDRDDCAPVAAIQATGKKLKGLPAFNALEFFMDRVGYPLLGDGERSGDLVADAQKVFSGTFDSYSKIIKKDARGRAIDLKPGEIAERSAQAKPSRLASMTFVITPNWVSSSKYFDEALGFRRDIPLNLAVMQALADGEPFIAISLGKAKLAPDDLFMSYDARAVVVCSPGEYKVQDYTARKDWLKLNQKEGLNHG